MSQSDPIIIIGSGVYGLSSAYHLSLAGYSDIKVFDQGDYENNDFSPLKGASAASTDLNKLVRASYVDKIHYQNLAIEALHKYYQWNDQLLKSSFLPKPLDEIKKRCLKENDHEPIFKNTGYIRLDDIESGEEVRNLANFEKVGLRQFSYDINNKEDVERAKITGWYSKLDPMNQRERVPTLNGVLDSFAGVALANHCLNWLKYLCERSGNVEFYYGSTKGKVKEIIFSKDKQAEGIITEDGKKYDASYVVVAAGGWSPKFVELNDRVEAIASSYIMIELPKDRPDLINKYRSFPMINWRMTYESNYRDDGVYMFPATVDGILKIGMNDHNWRYYEDDNSLLSVPNTSFKLLPKQSLNDYKKFLSENLPDVVASGAKIEKSKLCWAAKGQNNEFLIDFVPKYKNLIVCTGGGFHGFKFLPVIGRFTEGLISKKSYQYNEFFRFDAIKGENKSVLRDPKHHYALNSVEFAKSQREYYTFNDFSKL